MVVRKDSEVVTDDEAWKGCGLRRKGGQDRALRNRNIKGPMEEEKPVKVVRWSSQRGRGLAEVQPAIEGWSGAWAPAWSLGDVRTDVATR